jgi:hypothetical protein
LAESSKADAVNLMKSTAGDELFQQTKLKSATRRVLEF